MGTSYENDTLRYENEDGLVLSTRTNDIFVM